MNLLQAIILGIIQGLTEFLPISSSGHLSLFQTLFGLKQGSITFEVAVHLATLIAVVAVLWEDILKMIKKPFGKLTLLVVVGTIPTVIIAVIFKDLIELLFDTGATLGIEFIISGLILLYVEEKNKEKKNGKKLENMNYIDAGVIGVAQGIAIMPAISRSGLTLAGALFCGLNREFAIKFSFLMSIPAILGSVVFEGLDIVKDGGAGMELVPLLAGMAAAGISGYLAIKVMFKIFTKASLKYFSYYVFAVGGLIIIDQYFTHFFF
jgi:undecaprenyl-diphosphatase